VVAVWTAGVEIELDDGRRVWSYRTDLELVAADLR
jgi:hypothetical protein